MPRLIGAHTIDTGGIPMAARRAGNAGMTALQIFSAIPKYYNEKVGVKPERVTAFHAALAEAGIARTAVIVHAGYVLNCATPDAEKWERAATDNDRDAGVARVATAMTRALETVDGATKLLVENSAGAGHTIGRTVKEVAGILASLPPSLRARAGYGLDTCHLFASGYDISASESACIGVLDAFEQACGEPPSFLHLNDSLGALGSNKDRHMLLGDGEIGIDAFRWLLGDARTRDIPLLLETPQAIEMLAEDDASADPDDERMVTLLRSFDAAP